MRGRRLNTELPAASAVVTPETPMRSIGDLPRDVWAQELARVDSPLLADLDAIVRAASPHGALALAQAGRESTYGVAAGARSARNAWGLMVRGSNPSQLQRFGSWAEGAAEFARRLSDPSPPYDPVDISLRDYVSVYVGGPGCRTSGRRRCANGETAESIGRYEAALIDALNRLRAAAETGTEPPPAPPTPRPPADRWRPYPWPPMVDLIVPKPYEGAGFDRVPFRGDRIRGLATHITDGGGTIEGIRALFATGGQFAASALTDLVVGRDGRIGLLNDWRDPDRGGTRAGWANGGVDGLEGDGLAFYRKFPAINEVLVSVEHIARSGEAWTDAMIAASIELRTANAQALRTDWRSYPYHQEWGTSVELMHRDFATKPDPGEPYISTIRPVILREVGAKLRAWQGAGDETPPPVVPPTPPAEPETYTRFGFSREQVAARFGTMRRFNADGTVDALPFDPRGPLSLLWLARGEREGIFPAAAELRAYDSALAPGREWFATWANGWTAWLPIDTQTAGWRWLDEAVGEAR